jgi:hypothetical protein
VMPLRGFRFLIHSGTTLVSSGHAASPQLLAKRLLQVNAKSIDSKKIRTIGIRITRP